MRVCLGGTFDPLHRGHEALLDQAFRTAGPEGSVYVGLTSDPFAKAKRERAVAPYAERERGIRAYAEAQGRTSALTVRPLTDAHGPSASGDYDAIVVSLETAHTATEINTARRHAGLPPLTIVVVPFVLGDDLLPINATRIRAGLIDREGRRRRPLVVAVGSENPVKLQAVDKVFRAWLPAVEVTVRPVAVESGVGAQPFDEAAAHGARTRARGALGRAAPEAEYGVGIEAGLVRERLTGHWMDVQQCVIVDATGYDTHGQGPGFCYPEPVTRPVVTKERTVEEALAELSGEARIGRTHGAVGWLTEGRLDRTRLTEAAIEAALVPRVRRDLYDAPGHLRLQEAP